MLERIKSKQRLKILRKIVVLVAGILVTLIGVIMIVTPGPAVVVIPAGIAIIAKESVLAKRLLQWGTQKYHRFFTRVPKRFENEGKDQ